jgi:hypothetical protein
VLIQREQYVFVVSPRNPRKHPANVTLFQSAEAELIKETVEGEASRSFGKQLNYFREGKVKLVGMSFVSEVDVLQHVLRDGRFTDFSKVLPSSSHPVQFSAANGLSFSRRRIVRVTNHTSTHMCTLIEVYMYYCVNYWCCKVLM